MLLHQLHWPCVIDDQLAFSCLRPWLVGIAYERDTERNTMGALNNYLYDFEGSLLYLEYNGHQNPILIIKAPILDK